MFYNGQHANKRMWTWFGKGDLDKSNWNIFNPPADTNTDLRRLISTIPKHYAQSRNINMEEIATK